LEKKPLYEVVKVSVPVLESSFCCHAHRTEKLLSYPPAIPLRTVFGSCHAFCKINLNSDSQCAAKGKGLDLYDVSKANVVCASTTCTAAECCKKKPDQTSTSTAQVRASADEATHKKLVNEEGRNEVKNAINAANSASGATCTNVVAARRRRLSKRMLSTFFILMTFSGAASVIAALSANPRGFLKPFAGCDQACINSAIYVGTVTDASASVFQGLALAFVGLAAAISSAILR